MVFRYGNEPLKLWDSNLLICSSSFMYLDSKFPDSTSYQSMTNVSRSSELCRKQQIPGKSNCSNSTPSSKNFWLDGGNSHPVNSKMDKHSMHQDPKLRFSTWATLRRISLKNLNSFSKFCCSSSKPKSNKAPQSQVMPHL